MKNLIRPLHWVALTIALPFLAPVPAVPATAIMTLAQAAPSPAQGWGDARLVRVIRDAQVVPGSPSLTAISSDNSKVASVVNVGSPTEGDIYRVRVWNLSTGTPLYTLSGHRAFIGSIAFSPDSKLLATSDYDADTHLLTIHLWDAETGQRLRTLVRGISPKYYDFGGYYFRSMLAFSPDSQTLYSSATTPIIQVWNVNQGRLVQNLVGHPETLRDLQVSPDGRTLATTHVDGHLTLLDVQSGEIVRDFATRHTDAYNLAFREEGQSVMAVFESVLPNNDHTREIVAWQITGERIGSIDNFPDESWMVFSPDGKTFANVDYNQGIRITDLATGAELRQLRARSSNVAFSPDGQIFVAATPQGIRVWR